MRKTAVKLPQRPVVVPTVVEEEGVQPHMPLLRQLRSNLIDRIKAFCLVKLAVGPGDVVPRIVMQKRPVKMGSFLFDVGQEAAPQLAVPRDARDKALRENLAVL